MLIDIEGTKSCKKQKLTTDVLNFCMERLFPESGNNLTINVLFVKDILDVINGAQAACFPILDDIKQFNIEILNKFRDKKTITSLICHEMVHVKQFINCELTFTDSENFIYGNKMYKITKSNNKIYKAWPWEIEARKLGKKLTAEYMKGGI